MKPNQPPHFLAAALIALFAAACGAPSRQAAIEGPTHTNGSTRIWRTDFDRLAFDVRRAVDEIGWGIYSREVDLDAQAFEMRLQAPNENRAVVTAEPQGDRAFRVSVRVGRLGDQYYETEFLDALDEKLSGERGTPRQSYFELPPLQSSDNP